MKKQLKIQFIFAHPDDGEDCGGTAAQLANAGHTVQILSITNGQSGHYEMLGHKLVSVRYEEVQESKRRLGIDSYVVLDNNDGYLFADVPTRERLMKPVREFAPDIIITHRPYEYHPDVRNAALLVQDCASLLRVPNFLPLTPIPKSSPVVFFKHDASMKPLPFNPDIVVDIDGVAKKKLMAYDAHATQVYGFRPWFEGNTHVPGSPEGRKKYLENIFYPQWAEVANRFRNKLIEKYGEERGSKIKYAEAFEAAEYGAPHDLEAEREIFVFAASSRG
ncbi:MAG: PIG-L family deacetylase [Clostridiales bacterium]|jgi:LmbE family N-acetylglucosaminyl deacetylase|nr:PIG-L family deacetylase [Clostridiales bacterium]